MAGRRPQSARLRLAGAMAYRATAVVTRIPRLRRPRTSPLVMGILNVTPDSFSDGGRFLDPAAAVARARAMVQEGAQLIDIGGESTRPGAPPVSLDEELHRVLPVIRGLAGVVRVPLSIDTSKAEVARQAIAAGATIVNDVTALRGDPAMADVVASLDVSVILMHMRGTPHTMQRAPRYREVVADVAAFLGEAARNAQARGIARERILLDPGLGFGKTVRHNMALLRELGRVVALGFPVVIGPSRKRFIGETLDAPVDDRLAGTLACVAAAQDAGAHIVRVHDVKAAVQFLRMREAIASR